MRTTLIAGGGGPLGEALARRLGATGPDVRVVTAGKSRGNIVADLSLEGAYASVIDSVGADYVFHLVATHEDDLDRAIEVNVNTARRLFSHPRVRTGAIRIVVVGSAAEYGAVTLEENPVREDCPLKPVSIYGMTKAWQTLLSLYQAAQGADAVVARVFNLDGPGLSQRLFTGRVRAQIDELLAGRRSWVEVGRLDAVRDYVDTDAAAMQLDAIAQRGRAGCVYNVGSGVPVSMRDLLGRLLREHGLDWKSVREDAVLSNRKGIDVPVCYANMDRTRELLNVPS